MMADLEGPHTFYPFDQSFTLQDAWGYNFNSTVDELTTYVKNGVQASIVYAAQIGAAAAVLVVLLMLTKHDKRRAPVFILNFLALLFTVISSILGCLYYTSTWYNPYAYLSGDYTWVSSGAKATSITAAIFVFLLVICVELSLVLQVQVVCVTLDRTKRLAITALSAIVALLAIGFRFAATVIKVRNNVILLGNLSSEAWIVKARDITLTISICFFSAVFCVKLGWSLFQRRKLGLTQFGPMQIIFIGGAQTMVIPALFAILKFTNQTLAIGSNILTVTALSLPLTSLWASTSVEKPSKAARGPDAHRRLIMSSSAADTKNSQGTAKSRAGGGGLSTFDSETDGAAGSSRYTEAHAVEKDLEMQELGKH